MIEFEMLKGFIISLLLGALIGLEREKAYHHVSSAANFAGMRTFMLITFLGTLTALLGDIFGETFAFIGYAAFLIFVMVIYYITSTIGKDVGATTEVSAVLAFLFGMLCYTQYMELAVAFAIVTTLILSMKETIRGVVKRMKLSELEDTIKFAIIAFVILPLLPNQTYGPLDVFNPYIIWLMVVFISGISFVAYFLMKVLGASMGIGLTGLLGGLVSSTAVTNSMAIASKRSRGYPGPFVFATIIASATMFARVLLEVYVINRALIGALVWPLGIMGAVGVVCAFLIWHKKSNVKSDLEFDSPFTLGPALKFAGFFAFVLFFAKAAQMYFGDSGVYIAAFVSGFADVDAITVSMANLALTGGVKESVAVLAITIAACTNTAVKLGMAYMMGSKKFGSMIVKVFALILAVGIVTALLM